MLLEELKVDRIEVASARVSDGEFTAVKNIAKWAKENDYLNKIEVLTFLDKGVSINWLSSSGAKVQNLLTKGSINHLKYQIKKTSGQHIVTGAAASEPAGRPAKPPSKANVFNIEMC